MVIDLDKVEIKEGEYKEYLKDDGIYEVTIKGYEEGTSANKGTPFYKFEACTDDEKYITFSIYLTKDAEWKFKSFIMACGHPGSGSIDTKAIADKCVGKRLAISCKHSKTVDPITNQTVIGKYLEVQKFIKL